MIVEEGKWYINGRDEVLFTTRKGKDEIDNMSERYPFRCTLYNGNFAFSCSADGKYMKHQNNNSDLIREVSPETEPELFLWFMFY